MSEHRVLDVRPQTKLSLRRTLRFCLKGVLHRLVRWSLTLAVVVIAVAFFMVLLTESVILRSVAIATDLETTRLREAVVVLNHLFQPPTSKVLARRLSGALHDEARLREYARLADLSVSETKTLAAHCEVEQAYLTFFVSMRAGLRSVLAKTHRGRDIFRYLREPDAWDNFLIKLEPMRSLKLPTHQGTLRDFIDGFDTYLATLDTFAAAWRAKSQRLAAQTTKVIAVSTSALHTVANPASASKPATPTAA